MIRVSGLHKRFGSFQALSGVTLHVHKGEIYGFIGRNGAGKSTTMSILAGLSRPDAGTCMVNGRDVTKIDHPSELNIGYLPEEPKFYPWMDARETLCYLGNCRGRTIGSPRIDEVLDWVGLMDSHRRRVGGYSRGMKQRLGIAASLIHDPDLFILDEPSSALDPEGRSDVLCLIQQLKQMGKTVLLSSHILSDVERVCDRVGMIAAGKMVFEKPLAQLQKQNLVPLYDIVLEETISPDLVQELNGSEGVRAVEINDATLCVTVTDAKKDATRLMRFFADRDMAVRSFARRKNNLEDLFIQEANGS